MRLNSYLSWIDAVSSWLTRSAHIRAVGSVGFLSFCIWTNLRSDCGIMVCKGGHRVGCFKQHTTSAPHIGEVIHIQSGDVGSVVRAYASRLWCTYGATRLRPVSMPLYMKNATIINNPISRCGISEHHHEYRIHMLFAFVGSRMYASLCVHPVSLRCQSTMQYIVAAFRHRIYAPSHSFPI